MFDVAEINAGDTVEWSATFSDYPASAGWAANYYFAGEVNKTIAGVANGNSFDFTLPAADSTAMGGPSDRVLAYVCKVSLAGVVHTVDSGTVTVQRDPATAVPGYDGRSDERITLELIKAAIRDWATNPYQALTIGGRTSQWSLNELIRLRGLYSRLVRNEDAKERIAKGLAPGNRTLIQFDR
jgi:hypothetical protein